MLSAVITSIDTAPEGPRYVSFALPSSLVVQYGAFGCLVVSRRNHFGAFRNNPVIQAFKDCMQIFLHLFYRFN